MKEEKIIIDRRGSQWKKFAGYGLTAFIVIAAAIVLVFVFVKSESFSVQTGRIFKAVTPFIVGGLLAYLMNPLMVFFETRYKNFFYKHARRISRANKTSRVLAIITTVLCVILLIGFLLYLLIPQLTGTIVSIVDEMPTQVQRVEEWYWGLELEKTAIGEYVAMAFVKATEYVEDFVENRLVDTATNVLGSIASGIWSVLGTIYNILLGMVFAIYMLAYKEKLAAISKKITYASFKRKKANTLIRITRACHIKFIGSITGKVVDSAIIGLLCFAAMTLFGIPYPPLISVIVGVTNVIPFFGPFIGAIPSAFLILFASPIKCVYFLIIILVLQQFDGNILTPKIVGDTIGLSPLWVLFACTVFGSLWGVLGMLIGVPLMACIYMIIKEIVEDRLHAKGLMTETSDYIDLDKVDETEVFCRVVEASESASEDESDDTGADGVSEPDSGTDDGKTKNMTAETSETEAEAKNEAVSEYIPATLKALRMAEAQKDGTDAADKKSVKIRAGVVTERGKQVLDKLKGFVKKK